MIEMTLPVPRSSDWRISQAGLNQTSVTDRATGFPLVYADGWIKYFFTQDPDYISDLILML